jgi:hypothetical protein
MYGCPLLRPPRVAGDRHEGGRAVLLVLVLLLVLADRNRKPFKYEHEEYEHELGA